MKMNDTHLLPKLLFYNFIATKEYKRFEEFVQSCAEYRYIGLCYGEPGVGKSIAAMHFCNWNEEVIQANMLDPITPEVVSSIGACKGVLLSAPVTNTPKIMNQQIMKRINAFGFAYYKAKGETDLLKVVNKLPKVCPLVLIDEADRLNINSLEQIRHLYNEHQFGLILIEMPGMEKRLSRFPQLYSRVGFSHEYKKLSEDEMRFILPDRWKEMGLEFNPRVFSHVEAMNTIIRITSGNFRLIERLFSQIKRILKSIG